MEARYAQPTPINHLKGVGVFMSSNPIARLDFLETPEPGNSEDEMGVHEHSGGPALSESGIEFSLNLDNDAATLLR